MKKVIVLIAGLMVISTALTVAAAQAGKAAATQGQDKGTQVRQNKNQEKPDFFADLALTQEQKDALKAHREANRQKLAQLRELLHTKRQELNAEFQKQTMDKRKLNAIASDIKKLSGQLLDLRIQGAVFLKDTLTEEQFAKFQKKMKQLQAEIGKTKSGMLQRKKPDQPSDETDAFDVGKAGNP